MNVSRGNANDGYEYYVGCPEVEAYKLIYPDISDDAALGTIIGIHNMLLAGMIPALPEESVNAVEIENVVAMVAKNIQSDVISEPSSDIPPETEPETEPEAVESTEPIEE